MGRARLSGFAYLIALVVPQFAPILRAHGVSWLDGAVGGGAPALRWILLGLTEPGFLAGAILGLVAVRKTEDLWKAAALPLLGVVAGMATQPLHDKPAVWFPPLAARCGWMLLYSVTGASAAYFGKRRQPRALIVPAGLILGAVAAYWVERLIRKA